MSYLTDRLHADLDAHQALAEPPEHVLITTDDLAALLHELGTVQAQRFDAEGAARLWAALVRHVDDESKRYRSAWQSARRGRRVARQRADGSWHELWMAPNHLQPPQGQHADDDPKRYRRAWYPRA